VGYHRHNLFIKTILQSSARLLFHFSALVGWPVTNLWVHPGEGQQQKCGICGATSVALSSASFRSMF
jgi:hypothetical protein